MAKGGGTERGKRQIPARKGKGRNTTMDRVGGRVTGERETERT